MRMSDVSVSVRDWKAAFRESEERLLMAEEVGGGSAGGWGVEDRRRRADGRDWLGGRAWDSLCRHERHTEFKDLNWGIERFMAGGGQDLCDLKQLELLVCIGFDSYHPLVLISVLFPARDGLGVMFGTFAPQTFIFRVDLRNPGIVFQTAPRAVSKPAKRLVTRA